MKNRYSRAIERVKVTAEMRERIIKNLDEAVKKQNRTPSFKAYRRYISIAACLVILLVGAFLIFSNISSGPPPVGTNNSIAKCGSLNELSDAVGFKVKEVKAFPFDAVQTAYTSFFGTMAQITYTGEGSELTFRMSAGSEDNSGDYNEYRYVKNCPAGSLNVSIKGESGLYYLAVWQGGGYSYSIRITNGISEEEILKSVVSVY